MKYSGKGFIAVSAAAALTLSAFCLPAYASEGNWSLPTAGIASLIAVSGSLHEAMPAGGTADLTESEDIAVSPEPETSAGEAADVNASAPEYSAESGEQAETGESAGTGSAASDPLRAGIALLTATNKTSLANEPDAFGSGSVTESALLGITDGGAGETEQAADTAGTVSEAGSGADAAEQAGEIAKQAESQSGEATQQAANAGSIAAAEGASETEESGDDAAEKEQASDAGTSLAVADVSDYVNIRADKSEDAEILGKLYKDGVATVEGLEPPKTNWARPIDTPPFYGYMLRPGITFSYLSLALNERMQVEKEDGGVFKNIFAAGEITSGNVLGQGYMAGFGMTIGTVFGRRAGKEAMNV